MTWEQFASIIPVVAAMFGGAVWMIRAVVRGELQTFAKEIRIEIKDGQADTHKQLEEIRQAIKDHDEDIAQTLAKQSVIETRLDALEKKRR